VVKHAAVKKFRLQGRPGSVRAERLLQQRRLLLLNQQLLLNQLLLMNLRRRRRWRQTSCSSMGRP
jgi:hypothetical protein